MFSRFIVIVFLLWAAHAEASPPVFRISNTTEPTSFSTLEQRSASGAYIIGQIQAPFLWFENGKLVPWLGSCEPLVPKAKKQSLVCRFSEQARFSNGEQILAKHLFQTFLEALNPEHPAVRADLLLGIQGAEDLLKGRKPVSPFGFQIDKKDPKKFRLELNQAASEFQYNLANPLLAPLFDPKNRRPSVLELVGSGPYTVESFQPGRSLRLKPNPYFQVGEVKPDPSVLVDFRIINEANVALALYEKGELDFLRRFNSLYLKKFRNRLDLKIFPQFRFDFFAFGPRLQTKPELRKSLSESLDFEELQDYFDAPPRPGCPGLLKNLYSNSKESSDLCLHYQKNNMGKNDQVRSPLILAFGTAAAEDVERTALWMQDQWKNKLNLKIDIQELETKVYVKEMIQHPADIYRRGYGPDRPTCLAVAENFRTDYEENPLLWMQDKIEGPLQDLKKASSPEQSQIHCRTLLKTILDNYGLIPMGPMEFAVLIKPGWTGVSLTELNLLNLAHLGRSAQ